MTWLVRPLQVIFITTFCGLIALPLLVGSWSSSIAPLADNRVIAEFPKIKSILEDPRKYFQSAERYFDDRYGLRQTLIEWHSRLKYYVLSVSSSNDVFLGKDGWLYYNKKDDGDNLGYHRGLKTLNPADLSELAGKLQVRSDWMKSRGVMYVFLVAPNKITIYPEFLPDFVMRLSEESRLDHFMKYVKEHTTVAVVDPRPRLLEAKRHMLTYHRTDSHWNAYGSYAAYLQLVDVIQKRHPEVKPLTLSDNDFRKEPGAWPYVVPSMRLGPFASIRNQDPTSGGLARLLGLERILGDVSFIPETPEERCARVVSTPYRPKGWEDVEEGAHSWLGSATLLTTKCEVSPLNVLVIHDSFGPLLIPFLSETFKRVTYVWKGDFKFAKEFVENDKVDIVIQVHVERHLLPNYIY